MNIAVVAAIPGEETTTTEFAKLPLKEALRDSPKLRVRHGLSQRHGTDYENHGHSRSKGVARAVSTSNKSTRTWHFHNANRSNLNLTQQISDRDEPPRGDRI